MPTISYKCVTCGSPATLSCQFPLAGKQQGRLCARTLCLKHHAAKGKMVLCLAHGKFNQQVIVKTAELPQVKFVVPIERQLPPSDAVLIEEKKVELSWIKTVVRELTGEPHGSRSLAAGVVMLAPMGSQSFSVQHVTEFTKYPQPMVERFIGNLLRYGIWGADDTWCCEWGKLFSGDEIADDEWFPLTVSFVLDSLAAEGRIGRLQREDSYHYEAL